MRKILFINPPYFPFKYFDAEISFPVNLYYLGSIAEDESWFPLYLDMALEEKEQNDSSLLLEKYLLDQNIKIVGISIHTVRTSVTAKLIANRIKSIRPDIQIIAGGVNATFMYKEILSSPDNCIDLIVKGYGQNALRLLLKNFSVRNIPGIIYKTNSEIIQTDAQFINPKDFCIISFNDIPIVRYTKWTKTYPLFTHSGCLFSCNFCTSVMPGPYQNKEVYRDVDDVIKEMQIAISSGFLTFFMSANIFTSNRVWCLELLNTIIEKKINKLCTWVCMTRIEFIDMEILSLMKEAGCCNIAYGVEVASAISWKNLKKGKYDSDKISTAFKLTREAGIETSAYILLGAPDQTQEDFDNTLLLLREIKPNYRVISFFQPFPGTIYWSHKERLGISEIAPFSEWNFHEKPICRTKYFSKEELTDMATYIYLDRGTGTSIDINSDLIEIDNLYHKKSLKKIGLNYYDYFERDFPIKKILNEIEKNLGYRKRLIFLYWLSFNFFKNRVKIKKGEIK